MNRLNLDLRVRILAALVEGNSIRGTGRIVGVDKKTVLKLLADVGDACEAYFYRHVRNLELARVQCDEVWSFCHAKERNLKPKLRGAEGVGDLWTWTAIDPDTKLLVTWHLGKRSHGDADDFICHLSDRIVSERFQITTDGFKAYNDPIRTWLHRRADHGSEVKDYGILDGDEADRKYSPMVVKSVQRTALWGDPDPDHMTTAHVERQNLTMRMGMRRFTRLTNGFSKKAENLQRALALNFMYYNYCRTHMTIRTTPAMKAGLADRQWTLHDLANLADIAVSAAA